jgi:hypothetical protein
LIVVGDTAGVQDVIGATDIAASFVSNYAVDAKEIPAAGATLSVSSGGADLATTATKLYIDDSISAAKTVLTAEDLPVILATGSFEDDDNDDYNFEQYIYLGTSSDRKTTFGDNGEDQDPDLYVDMGTSTTNYFYATKIVFDTAVNFSDTDVHGNDLTLFNSPYTIASTSTNTEIVLFGASTKETINAGETKTVSFEGTDYTIEILGIQDQDTAIVKVGTESDEVTEGQEETVGGLTFYVDTVIKWDAQAGEGYSGYVQLSLGSQKMIFKHDDAVKVGEDEEDIDGTLVQLTGTGEVSVIEVRVALDDSEEDDLKAGDENAFEDPVWGTFQTEFYGMAPGTDSEANREMIEVDSSGKYGKVKFTTKKGDEKQVEFAYHDGSDLELELSKKKIHVVEGAAAEESQYIVVDAGGFAHLFEVDEIDPAGGSAGEVKFQDVFSGKTYEVVLPAGNNQVQKVIDGQTYYVNVTDGSPDTVRVTWKSNVSDSGMTYGDPGTHQTIFPALETKFGALVALAENVDNSNDEVNFSGGVDYFVLPGGIACDSSCTVAGVSYTITNGASAAVAFPNGNASVIVVEEEDINDAMNSIIVETKWYAADSEVQLQEPVMSAGRSDNSNAFVALESDDDYEQLIDLYGTLVMWHEADDNSADISYPNDQAIVGIGVGSDPSFAVGGGGGGTYNAAIPVTNPVAKFASEITQDATLDKNLVLVGGPCANAIVKTLLNDAWETEDSCDYWLNTHETLKNSGNGIVKIVEDVFGSGKKALIVAGTTAADTRNLVANKVIKPTVYEGLSGSEYIGAV